MNFFHFVRSLNWFFFSPIIRILILFKNVLLSRIGAPLIAIFHLIINNEWGRKMIFDFFILYQNIIILVSYYKIIIYDTINIKRNKQKNEMNDKTKLSHSLKPRSEKEKKCRVFKRKENQNGKVSRIEIEVYINLLSFLPFCWGILRRYK